MEIRDHKWLKYRLETIWQRYFPDIALINNVTVKFGRPSITRLGSIKNSRREENSGTIITINGHFLDPEIPEFVVDAVLAHELTHYAHGFCSPHKQAYKHPHRGSVVNNEMIDRGLKELLKLEKQWIKTNWVKYLKQKHAYY